MSEPFIGEIRMFAGTFAPSGWMFCEGQLLPVAENDALFQLLGTNYGGDGVNQFALPDLRARVSVHQGNGLTLGQNGGVETVTLTTQQMAAHSHALVASGDNATANASSNNVLASTTGAAVSAYGTDTPIIALASGSVSPIGGSQPHTNMQPYLCLNFIISLYGIFPST